jgi:pyruvate formate lyase activating enzyme
VHEVSRDAIFYQNSGGGVTISGGEPLVQPEFVYGLLRECKARNLHTALDTCGYVKWPVMQRVLEYTDLVLYDIKHLDSAEHKKLTGVNNELILSNLEMVKMSGARIWLRCPVIPGYNDSKTEFEKIAKFALSLEVEKVSLLPFFKYGEQKYEYLGQEYCLKNVPAPTTGHMEKLAGIVRSFGVEATVGY